MFKHFYKHFLIINDFRGALSESCFGYVLYYQHCHQNRLPTNTTNGKTDKFNHKVKQLNI